MGILVENNQYILLSVNTIPDFYIKKIFRKPFLNYAKNTYKNRLSLRLNKYNKFRNRQKYALIH